MDDQTALILALQLIALCCIAAALLLYLLCRIKNRYIAGTGQDHDDPQVTLNIGLGRAVLITSCDTAFGLQCALHLSNLGFRVFAGLRDPTANSKDQGAKPRENDSVAAKIIRAKLKEREMLNSEKDAEATTPTPPSGSVGTLITLPLDVTREDLLHEAVVSIRRHLPAGEDGLWAVINTAGLCCKGRLESQENSHWDAMLKHNVVGTLRAARTFMPLLRNKKGRLINLGANVSQNNPGSGLVAYTAARFAVEGASAALRHEMAPHGIHIITLQPNGIALEKIFAAPRIEEPVKADGHTTLDMQHPANRYLEYNPSVLPSQAMRMLEEALLSKTPKENYQLLPQRRLDSLNHKMATVRKKLLPPTTQVISGMR